MFANYSYRSDDGSDYSRLNPYRQLGKAGSNYSRTTTIQKPFSNLPTADKIFNTIMKRDNFKSHPSGISATLFYVAIIATHDLFNSDHRDPTINRNSSYLDLSPLYGSTKVEQEKIRVHSKGLLKPDTFADSRILLQPPGVAVLLILFSRNHNYIADYLFRNSNESRFKGQDSDEHLFQTARLINCGYYQKIILHDYLRAILGLERTASSWYFDPAKPFGGNLLFKPLPTGIGNQVSLEFNYIYRWHPAISEYDEEWIRDEFKRILEVDDPDNIDVDTFRKKMEAWSRSIPEDPAKWSLNDLQRGENGNFPDEKIVDVLKKGVGQIAGAFGANNIPSILRVVELTGIESARALGAPNLNEFRKFLNLVPYKSFEDMANNNQELANKLRTLYDNIDNVELYPGLMAEKTKPGNQIGSALALPFTVSRAILSDATNLIRNDRFYTDDLNLHNIGYWDWGNLQLPPEQEKLAAGGIIHQLILKHLPNQFKNNSAAILYPFTIPTKTKEILKQRGDDLWEKLDYGV